MEILLYLKNTGRKWNKEMLFYRLLSPLIKEESRHDITRGNENIGPTRAKKS